MKNTAQLAGILRIVLGAGTPLAAYLAAHGINAEDLTMWIVTGIPLLMAVLSWRANSHANQAIAAGQIPGVKVEVDTTADASVQTVAKDTSEATKNVTMEVTPKNPPPLNIPRRRS